MNRSDHCNPKIYEKANIKRFKLKVQHVKFQKAYKFFLMYFQTAQPFHKSIK